MPSAHELTAQHEKEIQRNPHPDFKSVEGSREDFDPSTTFHYTKTLSPSWTLGSGSTSSPSSTPSISIDPYAPGRPAGFNYKLLISAIVPRPIGFVSTRSKDGTSTNLAPFSYTQVVNHDPPVFVIGYAGGFGAAKDSLRNLMESGECVINMISEHFIEAANVTSVNAPYGVSEWALSGLTPAECEVVKASRVKEAVFSIEGKLMDTKEFESRADPGKKTGVLAIVEGVRFWAREDAVNEERNLIDPAVLRPVARMGGITYSRVLDGFELPRPDWDALKEDAEAKGILKPKADGQ